MTRPMVFDSCRIVVRVVAEDFGVGIEDIMSQRRGFSLPRQCAMWVCREATGLSFPVIANHFKRDHTTVIHGARKIDRLRNSADFSARMDRLIAAAQVAFSENVACQDPSEDAREVAKAVSREVNEIALTFALRAQQMAQANPEVFLSLVAEFSERMEAAE